MSGLLHPGAQSRRRCTGGDGQLWQRCSWLLSRCSSGRSGRCSAVVDPQRWPRRRPRLHFRQRLPDHHRPRPPAPPPAFWDADLAVAVAPAKPTFLWGRSRPSSPGGEQRVRRPVPATSDQEHQFHGDFGRVSGGSSDDCSPGGEIEGGDHPTGPGLRVQATWNQEISLEGCPSGQPAAKAGSYSVTAASGSVTSPEAPFQLTD